MQLKIRRARIQLKMNTSIRIYLILLLGVVLTFINSVYMGYLSPDSSIYIELAHSVSSLDGCVVQGNYYPVFPCGYPIGIALLKAVLRVDSIFITSKLLNSLLLIASYVLLVKTTKSPLVSLATVLNPISLNMASYTLSESLFNFAFFLSYFCIHSIHSAPGKYKAFIALLSVAFVIGCTSRYVFSPYLVIVFVAAGFSYGYRFAARVLPAFIVAAIFTLSCLLLNLHNTGFITGTERIGAPESMPLIIAAFAKYSLQAAVICLPGFLLAALPAVTQFRGIDEDIVEPVSIRFLLYCGIGYLALSFVTRSLAQFDFFDVRTIGFGILISIQALALKFTHAKESRRPVLTAACICLISLAIHFYPAVNYALSNSQEVSFRQTLEATRQLEQYVSHSGEKSRVVVSFIENRWARPFLYIPEMGYPQDVLLLSPKTAPYQVPETRDQFLARIRSHHLQGCTLDFSGVSREQLHKEMSRQHRISLFGPERFQSDYTDSIREYVTEKYVENAVVNCF